MISLGQLYAHPVVAATLRGLNPDLTCELEILQRGPVQEVGGQGGEAVVGQVEVVHRQRPCLYITQQCHHFTNSTNVDQLWVVANLFTFVNP